MWIQTGVTVRKRLSWVVTSVTLTFDLWPWPFAWTLLSSLVITPENFMMIQWWEHSQKGVTDGRTDGQTDRRTENTICRAAWSQLKIVVYEKQYWYKLMFHTLRDYHDIHDMTSLLKGLHLDIAWQYLIDIQALAIWHLFISSYIRQMALPFPEINKMSRLYCLWSHWVFTSNVVFAAMYCVHRGSVVIVMQEASGLPAD